MMNFSEKVERMISTRVAVDFEMSGMKVRAKYRGGRGRKLLVLLHAAMPAHSTNRPYFQTFLPVDVPQISISDPTLEGHDELASGWYVGHDGLLAGPRIHELIVKVAERIGSTERIYLGGSSGGFAAMHLSSLDGGSVAIALCPQTNLDTYNTSWVRRFRDSCFPRLSPDDLIMDHIGINLKSYYSNPIKNYTTILVSPLDQGHLFGQVLPALSELHPANFERVVLDVSFQGVAGHSSSIPPRAFMPWVRAALVTKSFSSSAMVEAHRQIQNIEIHNPESGSVKNDPRRAEAAIDHELQKADLLRDYHLRQDEES